MNSHPTPLVVRLAAALLIIAGMFSIVGIVASLLRGSISLNLGFVGIPMGRGLLAGSQSSRGWAVVLSGIGFVLAIGVGAYVIFSNPFRGGVIGPHWTNWFIHSVVILLCATVFFGLRSAGARAWFGDASIERTESVAWSTPLVLVGALSGTLWMIQDYSVQASLERIFPVHTRFEFRASSTGEPIHSLGLSGDGFSSSSDRKEPLEPRLSTRTESGPQGAVVTFAGLSGRPVEVIFTSPGYLSYKHTLTAESPGKIIVELEPQK